MDFGRMPGLEASSSKSRSIFETTAPRICKAIVCCQVQRVLSSLQVVDVSHLMLVSTCPLSICQLIGTDNHKTDKAHCGCYQLSHTTSRMTSFMVVTLEMSPLL